MYSTREARWTTIVGATVLILGLVTGCALIPTVHLPRLPQPTTTAGDTDDATALLAGIDDAMRSVETAKFAMRSDSTHQLAVKLNISGSMDFRTGSSTSISEASEHTPRTERVSDGTTSYSRPVGAPKWKRDPPLPGVVQSPDQPFEGIATGASDARMIGTERVRDVETTHITVQVDPQKRAEATGIPPSTLQPHPVDLWIDLDGRLRKQESHLSTLGNETVMTFEYFDFNAPVSIKLPDPSEVE